MDGWMVDTPRSHHPRPLQNRNGKDILVPRRHRKRDRLGKQRRRRKVDYMRRLDCSICDLCRFPGEGACLLVAMSDS